MNDDGGGLHTLWRWEMVAAACRPGYGMVVATVVVQPTSHHSSILQLTRAMWIGRPCPITPIAIQRH
jgi:hypothetical protein